MPKSLRHYYLNMFVEDLYQQDGVFYVQAFANQFALNYKQNPTTVFKKLLSLITRDEMPLVLKRSRDTETGLFLKMNKRSPNIINEIMEHNISVIKIDSIDAEICGSLTTALVKHCFKINNRDVQYWSIAKNGNDRFNILPATESKYICIQKDGIWTKPISKLSKRYKEELGDIVKSCFDGMYLMIPKGDKSRFKTHFAGEYPFDVFVNFYPEHCVASAPAHKDNVEFGATITSLTQNNNPGLFYVSGVAGKETDYPIHTPQGQSICLFKGIEHTVIWHNQSEIRMTLVCRW